MIINMNGGGINSTWIVKLWENASPSSAFAPQKIALDLADYSGIAVEVGFDSSSPARTEFAFRKNAIYVANILNAGSTGTGRRRYSFDDTGVVFQKAFYVDGSQNEDNVMALPLVIYGIKGVT